MEDQSGLLKPVVPQSAVPALSAVSTASANTISPLHNSIPYALSQPLKESAANFFFANYACDRSPFSKSYQDWLTKLYCDDSSNHGLRGAIEAAGMAGLSNISYAPNIASKSKEQYCQALIATKQALRDPIESVTDTTLITVILLGLFEVTRRVMVKY
jgi:hypothetical protein